MQGLAHAINRVPDWLGWGTTLIGGAWTGATWLLGITPHDFAQIGIGCAALAATALSVVKVIQRIKHGGRQ